MPLSPPPIFRVTADRDSQVTVCYIDSLAWTHLPPPFPRLVAVGVTFSQGFDVKHTLGPRYTSVVCCGWLQAPLCSLHHPLVRTGKAEMKYITDYPVDAGSLTRLCGSSGQGGTDISAKKTPSP